MRNRQQKAPGQNRYEMTCGEHYIGVYRGDSESEAIQDCLNAYDKIVDLGRPAPLGLARSDLQNNLTAIPLSEYNLSVPVNGEEYLVNTYYAKSQAEAVQMAVAQYDTAPSDSVPGLTRQEVVSNVRLSPRRRRR